MLVCRWMSLALVASTSTIRLPNTLPLLIIAPVVSILSTSFCAVPAFMRDEPVTTSAPTTGVITISAYASIGQPGLHASDTTVAPTERAYSIPAIT
ncbi:Uncharacterised protein [Vibrio cholerae]|nr:Uncharacterised protein [Vibrio cholerae]